MKFTRLVITLDSREYTNVKYQGRLRNQVDAENNTEWSFDIYFEENGKVAFVSPLLEHVEAIKVIRSIEFEIAPLYSNKWCRYKLPRPVKFGDEPLTTNEFVEMMTNYYSFMMQKVHVQFQPEVKPQRLYVTKYGVKQARLNRLHASIPAIVKDFNTKQRHIRIASNILDFDATAYVKKLLARATPAKQAAERVKEEEQELIESYENLDWEDILISTQSVSAQFEKMAIDK